MNKFVAVLFFLTTYAQAGNAHVFVALCDNKYQGIVKVPEKIGNGQDPSNNLYWGCGYGLKTLVLKDKNWQFLQSIPNPSSTILERCLFQHKSTKKYLLADAYNGAEMKATLEDFLKACAGMSNTTVIHNSKTILFDQKEDLIAFQGHNGLMDLKLDLKLPKLSTNERSVLIIGCYSKSYFKPYMNHLGLHPLAWSTGLMSAEGYTILAGVNSWISKDTPSAVAQKVAQAYHTYQKCGIKAASRLIVND